jgi:hypothetical protein
MKSPVGKPVRRAPAPRVRNPVAIEDIESLRCRAGIDDIELRDEIRLLRVGDTVNLTFLKDAVSRAGETLAVRITFRRGGCFRGSLAARPASAQLASLRSGGPILFRATHIHSIPKRRPSSEQ